MKSNQGFTLIEILITVMVISFSVIAFHQSFANSIDLLRRSETNLTNAFLIERSAYRLQLLSAYQQNLDGAQETELEYEDFPDLVIDVFRHPSQVGKVDMTSYEIQIRDMASRYTQATLYLSHGSALMEGVLYE